MWVRGQEARGIREYGMLEYACEVMLQEKNRHCHHVHLHARSCCLVRSYA